MDDGAPSKVGPYSPQQLLAMGAHAHVWVASGPRGQVALKVARVASAREALLREASVLAETSHPHLSRLIESADDGSWLALEWIDGETLDIWSSERSAADIVGAAIQLLDALEHLHSLGIVHGDLKPSNVMVDGEGRVRLIDLGVALRSGEAVGGGFRGTLGYAAPELLKGQRPSPATDLYGFAALLYSCLTGRTPFVAPDPAALTYLPLVSLPPPPSTFRPGLSVALNALLLGLLARDPSRRKPDDMGRIRQILDRNETGDIAMPVFGMFEEREQLRRAVVGAADGEPRVVVIYGVPGCGRRTLIAETVAHAQREGLPYIRVTPNLRAELARAPAPPVVAGRADQRVVGQIAREMLGNKRPGLMLLHAHHPTPALVDAGAIQLTPAPLSPSDAKQVVEFLGGDGDQSEAWWRESMGSPAVIIGRIRGYRRSRGLSSAGVPARSRDVQRIYEAIADTPDHRSPVLDLAERLGMGEHLLLDLCEVLFAERLVEAVEDGVVLTLTRDGLVS